MLVALAAPTDWGLRRAAAQTSRADVVRTQRAFPTGQAQTSVVLLERFTPRAVRMGRDFDYQVKLTNLTAAAIEDVVLTEQFPLNFNLGTMTPPPDRTEGGRAHWNLGTLGPRATKTIQARGTTNSPGDLNWCATVSFRTLLCASTQIVEPKLELALQVPADVLRCDPIPMRIVVRNTGSGTAENVVVTDTLPADWTATRGETNLVFNAGDLGAGESREFTAQVRSLRTGQFTNRATATEVGGLRAEATAGTNVREPVLSVVASGPDFRYLQRPATFQFTVTNQGDAPADNTVLVNEISPGMRFINADHDGRSGANRVTWNLGTIQPGASRTTSMTFNAMHIGAIMHTTRVTAVCASAETSAAMEVRGIPAILLEVIDIDDPIEVGAHETYEIAVTNQGSADDNNIVVTCTLPPEQGYISSSGPTTARVDGRVVRFEPLAHLPPKSKVTYRVVVVGNREGDVRFETTLESDVIISPVRETESTHIYE